MERIKTKDLYLSATKYQKTILDYLISGSILRSSEGKNYKCWIITNDKNIPVRRDSVEKITTHEQFPKYFSFGENIKLKQ